MLKSLAKGIAALYGAYLAICLLLLLPALNILTPRLVQQTTGRVLHSELLLFNPFTLAADLRGVALLDEDGQTFVGFERLQLNLSLASLWQGAVVLDEISLRGLDVSVRRFADGSFNFDDLLSAGEQDVTAEAAQSEASVPGLTINRLVFNAHRLRFSDATRNPRYDSQLADINLQASALSTVRTPAGDYHFALQTPENGSLDWRGELSLAAAHSSGQFTLSGMDLRPIHRYFAEDLAFALDNALLEIGGRYTADWSDAPLASLHDGRVRLHQIVVSPAATAPLEQTGISLQELVLEGIAADTQQQTLAIERVRVQAPAVAGYTEGDQHSLLAMLGVSTAEQDSDTTQTAEASQASAQGQSVPDGERAAPWTLAVSELALREGRIHWRSDYTEPALSRVEPISFTLRELRWPATADSSLELALELNAVSALTLDGTLHAGTGDGGLDFALEQLALPTFAPSVAMASNAVLSSGALTTRGNLELAGFNPARVRADTAVDALEIGIRNLRENAVGWQKLSIEGTDVDLQTQVADIGSVALEGYHGRVHILEDGRINIQLALNAAADEAELAEEQGTEPSAETAETAETVESGGPLGGWTVRSAGFALSDTRIDFRDDSMPLPFSTQISGLAGEIGALDSSTDARTPVKISGSADGYAPVRLEGEIAPFAAQTAVDLGLGFSGLDISRFSPYSVTYAGRRIDAGTLNLDVRYRLDGSALQGDNRAVIAQMKLGEKVESERAMELPLQLALALLTDARGVIDLDIPISGDVNNPSFSLGKVIGRALSNIITKAVTAPFRLLAGLVGSQRDLQQVAFTGGTEELGMEAREQLATLAQALAQRPQLRILASGQIDPATDLPPLREAQLSQSLLEDGLSTASLEARDADWQNAISARYASLQLAQVELQSEQPAAEPPALDEQLAAVLARIEVDEATLRELASARAAAVKRELVEAGGVAADRIAISTPQIGGDKPMAGVLLDVAA